MPSECPGDHERRGGGVRGNVAGSHVVMVRSIAINIIGKSLWPDCGGGRDSRILSYLKECGRCCFLFELFDFL